jgi:hypothetical protein
LILRPLAKAFRFKLKSTSFKVVKGLRGDSRLIYRIILAKVLITNLVS